MNNFFERRYIISGIFITVVLILLARLYYIQIVDDRYLTIANGNVIKQIPLFPARGVILDRKGKTLVDNELVYEITVIPKDVKPFDTLEFCRLTGITKEDFDKKLEKARNHSRSISSSFEKQLSPILYASLQERMSEFPGFTVQPHPIRTYPDSIAAQFLGYIGEVNDDKIKKSGGYYRSGDYIGITGVEKQYEEVLRGKRGVQNMLVNSRGVPQGSFENGARDTVPVPGERLTSSLDAELQKLGETLMKNKVGSIVAIEPSTGEILSFVSSPTYDPNLMTRERNKNYSAIRSNPYDLFAVKPIQARYMPGSSFKPLSALVALQEGILTPAATYSCPGTYRSITGRRLMKCTHVHGTVNLSGAIAGSCNGYFSWVFEKIMNARGAKATEANYIAWRDRVKKLGIGVRLDVDLPDEKSGLLASADFYNKIYRKGGWRSSTILSLAIGQGEVEATPLQLANIEATIANRGFYYKPHLIKAIGGKPVIKQEYLEKNYVGIDSKYFEQVINGMQSVVDYGTAVGSKIPGIIMCGKTGTVQNRNRNGKDHSVFVAFAPRDNPKIAIAVVVENSGDGGRWAAPIASFMVEKYLKDSITIRPSGIEPNYYINSYLLPELKSKLPVKKKSADSLKTSTVKVSAVSKFKSDSAPLRKKPVPIKFTAMLTKFKDDE
jgi:penicillin-binding protein 2